MVDEGDDVFFLPKEVVEVNGGSGKGNRVEGGHGKNEEVCVAKSWLASCEC